MLGLIEFLKTSKIEFDPSDTKVHLACFNGTEHPIDSYYAGSFQQFQERQGRRNFKKTYILSLIDLDKKTQWLFVGVYKVLGVKATPLGPNKYLYSTKLITGQSDLIGRIIVNHQRTRQTYVQLRPEIVFPILEISKTKKTIKEFPGYKDIIISFTELELIINQKIESWYSALSAVKGVYLILDTSTGLSYVGKASSAEEGIWQRWLDYKKNGHGGNEKLKKLLKENGNNYAINFQFSILEIADTHASDEYILSRESHWMNVLRTRKFGNN